MGHTTQPWLVDRLGARSVVLLGADSGLAVGCCRLNPAMPALPAEFTTRIEANFLSSSSTLIVDEFHSTTLHRQTLRMHNNFTSMIQLWDMQNQTMYTVTSDASEQVQAGHCTQVACPGGVCPGQVQGLGMLFPYISSLSGQQYAGNSFKVRGITCMRWAMNHTDGRPGVLFNSSNYTVQYNYQDNWGSSFLPFQRMLKRILVNGTTLSGRTFANTYEVVDMVPFVNSPEILFDPCLVAYTGPLGMPPGSLMYGCGCEAQRPPAVTPAGHTTTLSLSPLSATAIGVLVPLFTLGLGVLAGKWFERRDYLQLADVGGVARRAVPPPHATRAQVLRMEAEMGGRHSPDAWGGAIGWGGPPSRSSSAEGGWGRSGAGTPDSLR